MFAHYITGSRPGVSHSGSSSSSQQAPVRLTKLLIVSSSSSGGPSPGSHDAHLVLHKIGRPETVSLLHSLPPGAFNTGSADGSDNSSAGLNSTGACGSSNMWMADAALGGKPWGKNLGAASASEHVIYPEGEGPSGDGGSRHEPSGLQSTSSRLECVGTIAASELLALATQRTNATPNPEVVGSAEMGSATESPVVGFECSASSAHDTLIDPRSSVPRTFGFMGTLPSWNLLGGEVVDGQELNPEELEGLDAQLQAAQVGGYDGCVPV